MRRFAVWSATLAALTAIGWFRAAQEHARRSAPVALFSATQAGCTIVVPVRATDAELRATRLLQRTLAAGAGRDTRNFPIRAEPVAYGAALYVGGTRRSPSLKAPPPARAPHDNAVHAIVCDGALFLRGDRPEIVESAASWFLEEQLGAHWFMPGPLGHEVSRRGELIMAAGIVSARPGFVSRDVGVGRGVELEWYRQNRFEGRFEHGHNLVNIFRREDLMAKPEMAPMRGGARFIPPAGSYNWQPDLLNPQAVAHAAEAANRRFAAEPKRLSFSLSENDSFRFDDSPATLAAVAPPRFFRRRPDYSDVMFRFANEVASRVAVQHPGRYLPAYAYYWTENTPRFPVAKNVVPFLTADRTQWMHPGFAAEDRALIERWCRSGAEIVGVYDYFYGSPFLVPRPTLWVPSETIPFEFRAGVRVFNAEMKPNWALDGPKPWLAAQLTWSPEKAPAAVLETYYREFWAEAAEPMRAFYAECDAAWRAVRQEPRWIRFFEDDDQARIFSPERMRVLRAKIEEARVLGRSEIVRERVRFVSAGFEVTERFVEFCRVRDRVALLSARATPDDLAEGWRELRRARQAFQVSYAAQQRETPLAITMREGHIYERFTPEGRLVRALLETARGRERLRSEPELLASLHASASQLEALFSRGEECLRDPSWRGVQTLPVGGSADVTWTAPGQTWRGSGEPWEGRQVSLATETDGSRVLRVADARWEQFGQWVPAVPNALYLARVSARGKSSAGTLAAMLVSFLDAQQKHIGLGVRDRVISEQPTGSSELTVIVRAPPNVQWIGVGLQVENQLAGDFVEFSRLSLKRLAE